MPGRMVCEGGDANHGFATYRLDQDFIVFRGHDQESAGQLLKGVVVLCLSSSLRIEDVRLRLTGTLRLQYVNPSVLFSATPRLGRRCCIPAQCTSI